MAARKLLITGATGQQGGATIKALLASGSASNIFALSRSPSSPSATALQSQGITVVKGELTDSASIESALKGMDAAFLVTGAMNKPEVEIQQGKTFIDAAKKTNLPYLVYTSVDGAERESGVPHFDSKHVVEEYLRASKIPHTILRPTAFYEGLGFKTGIQSWMVLSVFRSSLGSNHKSQFISIQDIGWFGANALLKPEQYKGREIALAGEDATVPELAAAYGRANGTGPAWIAPGFIGSLVASVLPFDFRAMLKWFKTHGYEADIPKLKEEHPGLMNFETWVKQELAAQESLKKSA